MEQKIFYQQPYLNTLQTTFKEVVKKDDKFHVVLEQTIFCPEGGGQPCDMGTINSIPVSGVYEQDNVIYHILDQEPTGPEAICQLDSERRLYNMQQHSGQHLLSAVFYNLHKLETKSFHLGADYATIDLERNNLSDKLMSQVEDSANDYIRQNLLVKAYIVEKGEVGKLPVRKAPTVDENIRIVEIDKIDFSPCCGTHISRTGELCLLKILKHENNKQMTRVYFVCGKRALQDYQHKHSLLANLCNKLAANEESLAERVNSLLDTSRESGRENKKLKEELFKFKAADIVKEAKGNLIVIHFEDYRFEDIQLLAQNIVALGDYVVILSTGMDKKLLIAHGGKAKIDSAKLVKENITGFKGRGGGSPKFAQASFENVEDMMSFRDYLRGVVVKED